jgi:hypothetical protein
MFSAENRIAICQVISGPVFRHEIFALFTNCRHMNNALPGNAETLFSLSVENSTLEIAQDQSFTFEKMGSESFIGKPVNNYFKSMKEIETEFLTSMNAAKTTLKNMISDLSQFSQNLITMDGTMNFPDPDDLQNRYLEENY